MRDGPKFFSFFVLFFYFSKTPIWPNPHLKKIMSPKKLLGSASPDNNKRERTASPNHNDNPLPEKVPRQLQEPISAVKGFAYLRGGPKQQGPTLLPTSGTAKENTNAIPIATPTPQPSSTKGFNYFNKKANVSISDVEEIDKEESIEIRPPGYSRVGLHTPVPSSLRHSSNSGSPPSNTSRSSRLVVVQPTTLLPPDITRSVVLLTDPSPLPVPPPRYSHDAAPNPPSLSSKSNTMHSSSSRVQPKSFVIATPRGSKKKETGWKQDANKDHGGLQEEEDATPPKKRLALEHAATTLSPWRYCTVAACVTTAICVVLLGLIVLSITRPLVCRYTSKQKALFNAVPTLQMIQSRFRIENIKGDNYKSPLVVIDDLLQSFFGHPAFTERYRNATTSADLMVVAEALLALQHAAKLYSRSVFDSSLYERWIGYGLRDAVTYGWRGSVPLNEFSYYYRLRDGWDCFMQSEFVPCPSLQYAVEAAQARTLMIDDAMKVYEVVRNLIQNATLD